MVLIVPNDSPFSEDPVNINPIPSNVVDWGLVELRDKNNSTSVLASKSAFFQNDGKIVSTDGNSPIEFLLPADEYFIAIRHRNHLAVMSTLPVSLTVN